MTTVACSFARLPTAVVSEHTVREAHCVRGAIHGHSASLIGAAITSKSAVVHCGCSVQCQRPCNIACVVGKCAATERCCCCCVHCAPDCYHLVAPWRVPRDAATATAVTWRREAHVSTACTSSFTAVLQLRVYHGGRQVSVLSH
jgi:hypothetical protein